VLAELIPKVAEFEREPTSKWRERPSNASLGQRCLRMDVFHALGFNRRPLPGRALLVFDDSSWHEELTAEWIARTAFTLHSRQMPLDIITMDWVKDRKKYECSMCGQQVCANTLHGHSDGCLLDPSRVERNYEHKAINHFSFQALWGGEELPLGYLAQDHLYTLGLSRLIENVNESLLLVKNKNTAQYIDFHILHDFKRDKLRVLEATHSTGEKKTIDHTEENVLARICEHWYRVRQCVENRFLPVRSYGLDDWQCSYCGWHAPCWENYTQEIKERQDVILPESHFLPKLERYLELREYGKEFNNLKKELKQDLETYGLRGGDVYLLDKMRGKVGGISVMLKVFKTTRVNMEKLPVELVEAAKETKETVAIDVRVIKPTDVEKRREEKLKQYLEVTDEARLEAGLTGKRIVEL